MGRKDRMTIDELAHASGVSSRSIRYYQTRGLLPAPTVKGRTGLYDQRHVERLELIQELQAEGLNLQAIGWLLSGSGGVDSDELRRLKRAILDGWVQDQPALVEVDDVLEELDIDDIDGASVRRAIELRLIEPAEDEGDEDGRWRVLLPAVLAAGRELNQMGVATSRALDVLEEMRKHAKAVAKAYVRMFDEVVVAPWDERGRPADEWPAIREAVERIRPLAGEALLSVFNQVMADAVADAVGEPPAEA